MRPRHALLAAVLFTALLAGCADPDDADDLSAATYQMNLEGMPTTPMAPGETFNVTVRGMMGGGVGMHRMDSDHIGAHFWNMSVMDPTGMLGNATTCAHTGGEMPGEFGAMCTAPMEPGTYYLRAHARMDDGHAHGLHHYWGGEMPFTIAAT